MRLPGFVLFVLFIGAGLSSAETTMERKISFGGQLTGGNTQVSSFHAALKLNRNRRWVDEITVKGSVDREFSGGAETQFKGYGSLRYARSITKNYYQYYKLEGEHDRFQDINIRIIPAIGLGCWFADEAVFRSRVEAAVGYQRQYLVSRTAAEMLVLTLSSDLMIGPFTNDLDVYAAVNDFDNYRLTDLAGWQVRLNTHYAFKLSLKGEYNNRPAAGVQQNDLTFTTSLEYAYKETKT